MVRVFRIVWLLALAYFSAAPWIVKFRLGLNGTRHGLCHFVAFFLTALIFSTRLDQLPGRPDSADVLSAGHRRTSAQVDLFRAITLVFVAVLLEGLETILFHNSFEWQDVTVDCLGILAAVLSLRIWQNSPMRDEP